MCIVGTSFGEFGWTKKLSFLVLLFWKGVFQKPLKYIALTKTKIVEARSNPEIRFLLSEVQCSDLEMCTLLRTVIFTWRHKVFNFIVCFISNPRVYLISSWRTIVKICRMNGGLEVLFKDVSKLGFYWESFFKKCSIGEFQGHISRRFLLGKNCRQCNMLTVIKVFSVLWNNKANHFTKGCETDACELVHLFWLAANIIWPFI